VCVCVGVARALAIGMHMAQAPLAQKYSLSVEFYLLHVL